MRTKPSALAGIVRQLCPRCRAGRIFSKSAFWFPPMCGRCPVCNLKFEREPGYFLGAMYIGYGLALVTITVLAVVVWALFRPSLQASVAIAVVLFLPLAPFLTFMARVLWIYLDQSVDPDKTF